MESTLPAMNVSPSQDSERRSGVSARGIAPNQYEWSRAAQGTQTPHGQGVDKKKIFGGVTQIESFPYGWITCSWVYGLGLVYFLTRFPFTGPLEFISNAACYAILSCVPYA